jgi:hypothetical protein
MGSAVHFLYLDKTSIRGKVIDDICLLALPRSFLHDEVGSGLGMCQGEKGTQCHSSSITMSKAICDTNVLIPTKLFFRGHFRGELTLVRTRCRHTRCRHRRRLLMGCSVRRRLMRWTWQHEVGGPRRRRVGQIGRSGRQLGWLLRRPTIGSGVATHTQLKQSKFV